MNETGFYDFGSGLINLDLIWEYTLRLKKRNETKRLNYLKQKTECVHEGNAGPAVQKNN